MAQKPVIIAVLAKLTFLCFRATSILRRAEAELVHELPTGAVIKDDPHPQLERAPAIGVQRVRASGGPAVTDSPNLWSKVFVQRVLDADYVVYYHRCSRNVCAPIPPFLFHPRRDVARLDFGGRRVEYTKFARSDCRTMVIFALDNPHKVFLQSTAYPPLREDLDSFPRSRRI